MTDTLNGSIGACMTGIFALALMFLVARYSFKILKEYSITNAIFLSILFMLEVLVLGGIVFLWLPYFLEDLSKQNFLAESLRWSIILAAGLAVFIGRKHAEWRGAVTFTGTYLLFLFGWVIDGWMGMFMVSLPILFAWYLTAYYVALAVVPASSQRGGAEALNRVMLFLAYLWGIQPPIWKSPSGTAYEPEKRIDGGQGLKAVKSLVWTYPHQAAGVLKGADFSVHGPGAFYIDKDSQPFELVDLRSRTRTSFIKAISREGIPLEAQVSVSFRVDEETWTREQYHEYRRANIFQGREPDKNLDGIFPYSYARVKAALSFRSKKTPEKSEEITVRWDDRVLAMAEEAARETLSERSIEELWRARVFAEGSAAEEIANVMRNQLDLPLRKMGIRLINAKAFDFSFNSGNKTDKEDEIVNRQLDAWTLEWEKKRSIALENGKAEAERIQQDARAYAHSALLTAIAEGLQQTRALHENLPRYVIALRFIGVLEQLVDEQQGDENDKDSRKAQNGILHARQHLINPRGE